jgi:NADPH:quinone reductase
MPSGGASGFVQARYTFRRRERAPAVQNDAPVVFGLRNFAIARRAGAGYAERMESQVTVIVGRSGDIHFVDESLPAPPAGHIQVRTVVSGISPGTELLLIDRSRDLGDDAIHLGYQLCGEVTAVGDGMGDSFASGDLLACYGGPYVRHASAVNVPRHLAVKLDRWRINPAHASFCGLGAVALHAFRCAGLSIGETCAVLGLGMLGNLTAQIATAAGCRVAAMDPVPPRREAAAKCGVEACGDIGELARSLHGLTRGHYADAVLVVVSNCTDELLLEAVRLCRERGRVIIVGTAHAALPREQLFAKEVTLMVSRAAGPGRYDSSYEAGGHDYPYAHARWTEGRNLEEFIRLLTSGAVAVEPLLTDELPFSHAAQAYEMLRTAPHEHLGVVLKWTS